MAEETVVETTDEVVVDQDTVETDTVETPVETEPQQPETVETTTEEPVSTSFSKDDIEWDESLGFTDETKDELVSKYSSWFKDKESANAYIKEFTGVKFTVAYEIYNKNTGILCVTGESNHCFTDSNLKPLNIKKHHNDVYKKFISLG